MAFGLPGWPGGDPEGIRETARAWDALADDISQAVDAADKVIVAELEQQKGAAKNGFVKIWDTYAENQRTGAENARTIAENLRTVAEKIDEAHTKYEHIMEGLAAAAAVGIVVGIFTFGIGDAVADTAAIGAAATAIASLLEELGVTIAAESIAGVMGSAVGGAWLSLEFSVSLQEGAHVGEGKGLTVTDLNYEELGVATLTGGIFGGAMDVAELLELGIPARALLGGGVMGAGDIAGSEISGEGMPSINELLVAALLGGGGGALEGALGREASAIKQAEAQIAGDRKLAIDFAALYKDDPESLAALRDDPYQSQHIRDLAGKYQQLFDSDPTILIDMPNLAQVLSRDPQAVNRVLAADQQLTQVAHDLNLPPGITRKIWRELAQTPRQATVTYDGVQDFVKDWLKHHHELSEELERELEAAG
ncbi:WXG100-like domain-containing protein [Nocardioides acrostichi]|uniref:Outer membrane channel protein CpnT-like N-terminal domain-containing protein n=1 Tax=Nocardioides acrostichi TaxID=2784339 RepID=A0A930YCK0_9ACTN|nr:hypothetical protein [Nocardioides acrostichi]MBF4161544.1 hypothetical protein [Nocardioides acrostichi]